MKNKRYIYPKLSSIDLLFIRLGGAGLGNLMSIYMDAYVYAVENQALLMWPTWASLKVGPWVRREKDKRFYGNLFRPINSTIHGINRIAVLLFRFDEVIVINKGSYDFPKYIKYRNCFRNHLISITKSKWKHQAYKDSIVTIHIRLGDYPRDVKRLDNNSGFASIPINWFVSVVEQINKATSNKLHFIVFTDGERSEVDELARIDNVHLAERSSSIGDMLSLGDTKLMVASRSTYSLWARFLGNCSCITYKNSLMENVCEGEHNFEYETDGKIGIDIIRKIQYLYRDCL